ncbi:MAG: DUF3347 domain-containing protein [Verrucomicrobiota bacterium]
MKRIIKITALAITTISLGIQISPAQTPMDPSMKMDKPMTAMPMEPAPTILTQYLLIQKALAADSTKGISEASTKISELVEKDTMKMFPTSLATQAKALAKQEKIEDARKGFASLSAELISSLKAQKINTGKFFIAECPMAKAEWIQDSKKIANPYYGSSMATCGSIKGNL